MASHLVIDSRPGISILSGRVVDIKKDGDVSVVTLRNNKVPVGCGDDTEIEVLVDFRTDVITRMELRRGSFIMATTVPHILFPLLRDGANVEVKEQIHVRGYRFCYSGEMMFDARGKTRGGGIVFGNIASAFVKDTRAGYVAEYELSYRSGKENKLRKVVKFNEMLPDDCVGKKVIFLTGTHVETDYGIHSVGHECIFV